MLVPVHGVFAFANLVDPARDLCFGWRGSFIQFILTAVHQWSAQVMRLLFAVVHYFKPGNGRHGSLAANPQPRINALRHLILQIHRLFGHPAATLNHLERRVDAVDDGAGLIFIFGSSGCCSWPTHDLLVY